MPGAPSRPPLPAWFRWRSTGLAGQQYIVREPGNAPDQRFNNAETFYADNFCNTTSSGAYYAPRAYSYGMFSFTKSMLLHDPGGVLSPIQYLRTETPGVFPG